jgi:hypothetical protein
MDKETAIELAGSIPNLARILGVSRSAVYGWGASLPERHVWHLKLLRPEWFREDAKEARETETAKLDRIAALANEIRREVRQWRQQA